MNLQFLVIALILIVVATVLGFILSHVFDTSRYSIYVHCENCLHDSRIRLPKKKLERHTTKHALSSLWGRRSTATR